MRKLFALALCLALALTATAMPAFAAEAGSTTYRMLIDAEMPSLNYLASGTAVEFRMSANCLDTLIEFDNLGQVQPALAKSWDVSDDGTVYTFHLRDDAWWVTASGEKVDTVKAGDFVAAAKYILDGVNAASTNWVLADIIEGASAYLDGTTPPEEGAEPAPVTEWDTVGVKAIDDLTIQYTLTAPAPYFLNMLDYVCFMPVNEAFLAEKGADFGVGSNDSILYCGAYILSTYQPQEKQIYTKNPHYWDAERVYIDAIEKTFNKETNALAPELFLRGEIDEIEGMSNTVAQQWLASPDTADMIRPQRQTGQYTYFYSFNYDPQFDAIYEPENWKLVVNNENFRKSFFHGLDRVKATTVHEADNPEALINNTITPKNIILNNGLDYSQTGALAAISATDPFDSAKALEYKAKAVEELTAAGATFPVKVPMLYNPTTVGWAEECQVVEQQLEGLLGTDYIDIIVEAGPSTGFLSAIRRAGKYAFMKCNWGLDFPDPVNTAEPFRKTGTYMFLDKIEQDGLRDANGTLEYYNLMDIARPIYADLGARYEAFAEAEAWLINHAIVIPIGSEEGGYWASRLNPFEGQYNACGLSTLRFKGQHLLDKPMSTDDFFNALDEWEAARAALAK